MKGAFLSEALNDFGIMSFLHFTPKTRKKHPGHKLTYRRYVNALKQSCLCFPPCNEILSLKNVPGFNLQNVPDVCPQQLYRMDDPGINAQHVDNRVGLEGTQVILPSPFFHHLM